MNKLVAGAVALCIAVPSTFAAWDLFPVIEQGSAEANINSDGKIKIRYGLMDNLEIFSTNDAATDADYTIGARYQIMPDMLSAYADLGVPASNGKSWGLTPGVQFSKTFTETISLGVGLGLPVDFNHSEWGDSTGTYIDDDNITHTKRDDGLGLGFTAGLELDIAITEQVLFWVGVDFEYENLTNAGKTKAEQDNRKFEAKEALSPALGFSFSRDNLSVGTSLSIGLNAKDDKGKDTIGLEGGVDFTVKF